MGTWGPGIYDCDIACDVRDAFVGELRLGKSELEATDALEAIYINEISDSDDAAVFWVALADTQWEYGRLIDRVKLKALKVLESGVDEAIWNDLKSQRERVYAELREKLARSMPKKKRVKRWKPKLHKGDVFTLEVSEDCRVYGRVIVVFPPSEGFPEHAWAVYYALDGLDNAMRMKRKKMHEAGADWHEMQDLEVDLEDVVNMDIGLVSHFPSEFEELKPIVIGNIPLESRYRKPMYFYTHTEIGKCRVFDVFKPDRSLHVPFEEVPAGIPRWNDFGLKETLKRLGVSI